MSSLKRIVCLANSWKLGERCIAGININTGQWVRPVCDQLYPQDGKILQSVRLINDKEPELLEILNIPLAETGNNFGFECENLSVLVGQWKCLGEVKPTDLLKYCGSCIHILHNSSKYVKPSYLQNLPFYQRRTLQLVRVVHFSVQPKTTSKGNVEWRGTIQAINGQRLVGAKIVDPVFVRKLNMGYQPQQECLVTVSLSMPYVPHSNWEGEAPAGS